MLMRFLNHPIEGYDNQNRVQRVANRLFRAARQNNEMESINAATEINTIYSGSRFNKWGFRLIGSIATAAAIALPGMPPKLVFTPLAALTLLISRDLRRTQKAAATIMSTPEYTEGMAWVSPPSHHARNTL